VSVQNARPAWSQRSLIVVVGAAGLAIAAAIGSDAAATLESFLLLIGSVFVPLFAVFLVDWGIRAHGRFGERALFDGAPPGIRWRAVLPWVVGFLAFQWCAPTTLVGWWTSGFEHVVHGWFGLPFPLIGDSALGGSIPGFVAAFVVALVVLPRRPATAPTP
jgi:purine-cytosine permease-like protein